MEDFRKTVWRGFVVIVSFLFTLAVAFWIVAGLEHFLGGAMRYILPFYIPGMGILGFILLLFLVGRFLDKDRPGSKLIQFGGRQLERAPFLNTPYSGIRDLIRSVSMAGQRGKDAKQVVLVPLKDDIQVMGIVTSEDVPAVYGAFAGEAAMAVYIPFSYQLGGFTVYVPSRLLKPLDISVGQAMELVLSAAMAKGGSVRTGQEKEDVGSVPCVSDRPR
ncbi:MAG: DUF502 domain-containing protein [Syntrophobacteraceae bacterium]|nr:DUF502 domain-containing protein [Syntrophobacteraceae bacterium]